MAKTKEKDPIVELSAEEQASLAHMEAEEQVIAETSEAEEARSAEEYAKVEELRSNLKDAKKLEEGSPEWLARRRQRRPADEE